jgi:hypothetical protein
MSCASATFRGQDERDSCLNEDSGRALRSTDLDVVDSDDVVALLSPLGELLGELLVRRSDRHRTLAHASLTLLRRQVRLEVVGALDVTGLVDVVLVAAERTGGETAVRVRNGYGKRAAESAYLASHHPG